MLKCIKYHTNIIKDITLVLSFITNTNIMFNTTQQQQQNVTLDQVLRETQFIVDQFEATMWGLFHDASELSPYQKQRIADEYLIDRGYDKKCESTYQQWGIMECTTPDAIKDILDEYIEYRKDKAAGRL